MYSDKINKNIADAARKIMEDSMKKKEEPKQLNETSYSAKDAAAGKDIGKPGKNFDKIADKASKEYGSKAAGEKVAGAVLAKLRKEETEVVEGFESGTKVGTTKKTPHGVETKTATGVVHHRTYEDENDDDEDDKKEKRGAKKGASFKRRYNTKTYKESFTEILANYKEGGIKNLLEDMELVEILDEEVDNETYAKEVKEAQDKSEGKGKKAEVAKGKVVSVKNEEVEVEMFDADTINDVKIDEPASIQSFRDRFAKKA